MTNEISGWILSVGLLTLSVVCYTIVNNRKGNK
jgi:hypothetical protein